MPELTTRASLILRVISFGHKLVENRNAWTTSRHTHGVMKSRAPPLSDTPHGNTLLLISWARLSKSHFCTEELLTPDQTGGGQYSILWLLGGKWKKKKSHDKSSCSNVQKCSFWRTTIELIVFLCIGASSPSALYCDCLFLIHFDEDCWGSFQPALWLVKFHKQSREQVL